VLRGTENGCTQSCSPFAGLSIVQRVAGRPTQPVLAEAPVRDAAPLIIHHCLESRGIPVLGTITIISSKNDGAVYGWMYSVGLTQHDGPVALSQRRAALDNPHNTTT
jgi:hypothetical protein